MPLPSWEGCQAPPVRSQFVNSLASVAHFFCCLFHSRPFQGGGEKPDTILPSVTFGEIFS